MNERCAVALANPLARADESMDRKFWQRQCVDGRFLSTIVTLNK
jgi:hypothetical protein